MNGRLYEATEASVAHAGGERVQKVVAGLWTCKKNDIVGHAWLQLERRPEFRNSAVPGGGRSDLIIAS